MRISRLLFFAFVVLITVLSVTAYNMKWFRISSSDEKKIIVVLKTSDLHSDFWQTVGAGAKAAAKEKSVTIDIQGPLQDTDTDGQIHLLEKAIAEKPQAIVLAPTDSNRLTQILDQIRTAGIPLVIMDSKAKNDAYPKFVSNNHYEDGRQAGLTAASETTGHPHIAVISDNRSDITSERETGIKDSLSIYSGSNLGTYYNEGSEEKAYGIAKQLLIQHPELNGIITLTESATLGVAKAIKEEGRKNSVKSIAFDSSIYEIKLMEEDLLDAVIVQRPFNTGYMSIKTALDEIAGKRTAKITYIDSVIVKKADMYKTENQKLLFPFIEK